MHFSELLNLENHRHVLGISGGKDSAALAVYIKDRYPELSEKIEYFFITILTIKPKLLSISTAID